MADFLILWQERTNFTPPGSETVCTHPSLTLALCHCMNKATLLSVVAVSLSSSSSRSRLLSPLLVPLSVWLSPFRIQSHPPLCPHVSLSCHHYHSIIVGGLESLLADTDLAMAPLRHPHWLCTLVERNIFCLKKIPDNERSGTSEEKLILRDIQKHTKNELQYSHFMIFKFGQTHKNLVYIFIIIFSEPSSHNT